MPPVLGNWCHCVSPMGRSLMPEDDPLKKFAKKLSAPKRFGRASVRVNHPFDSVHNFACRYC